MDDSNASESTATVHTAATPLVPPNEAEGSAPAEAIESIKAGYESVIAGLEAKLKEATAAPGVLADDAKAAYEKTIGELETKLDAAQALISDGVKHAEAITMASPAGHLNLRSWLTQAKAHLSAWVTDLEQAL